MHLAVVPELAADSQRSRTADTHSLRARSRQTSTASRPSGARARREIPERRHGIVEEHRAEDADHHQVDCRPVERVHLRVRSLEPDVRQPLVRCPRASDGQHRRGQVHAGRRSCWCEAGHVARRPAVAAADIKDSVCLSDGHQFEEPPPLSSIRAVVRRRVSGHPFTFGPSQARAISRLPSPTTAPFRAELNTQPAEAPDNGRSVPPTLAVVPSLNELAPHAHRPHRRGRRVAAPAAWPTGSCSPTCRSPTWCCGCRPRDRAGFVAVAQMRPTTGPTALPRRHGGHLRAAGPAAAARRGAATSGGSAASATPTGRAASRSGRRRSRCVRAGRVVAVVSRHTNLAAARTPSRLELTYLGPPTTWPG